MSAKDLNMELLLLLSSLRRTRSLSVSASRLGMSLSTASRRCAEPARCSATSSSRARAR